MSRTGFLSVIACTLMLAIPCPQVLAQEPMLQCVPYARQVSGIQIYGDAHSWWQQAQGHYARGNRPAIGAVMAFKPHGSMQLGHVAAVSKIVDSRRVLLDHANWSPVNGRRGQIERNVLAEDVSVGNDWSEVRVWYAPIGGLGSTHYPVNGFIYPQGVNPGLLPKSAVQVAARESGRAPSPSPGPPSLSRDERKALKKAERRAIKEARNRQKQIEKQRREYADDLARQARDRRETAQLSAIAASPQLPGAATDPVRDPIGDLIDDLGV